MGRIGSAARVRYSVLVNRGDAVQCPLCERWFARFRDDWNRANAICWRCGSHERQRALWLYLSRLQPQLLANAEQLLHFASEWCLERRLRGATNDYTTADLDPSKGELQLDITNIALADDSFDAIICSHVLEHVEDDAAAMRELRRVLRPSGWLLVMVPLDINRMRTYEDPSITEPEDRKREFRQADHVRLYAPDIADRLAIAGFEVTVEHVAARVGPEAAARYGLLDSDYVFACR